MNGNEEKKQKNYCCSNPNCLNVFSEPIEIKYYACPECKTQIDLDTKEISVPKIYAEKTTLIEDQRQEANSQIEKQEKPSKPVIPEQDKRSLPVSDPIEVNYFSSKDPEPQEPTLLQRLEAMVEQKNKDATKQNDPSPTDSGCLHYFGYLHQRQKGEAMPETCIVCPKSIDCLMSNSDNSTESLKEIKKWYSF